MQTTEHILNILNPMLKGSKGSKQLLSKLTKGTNSKFKDILTSLGISEMEKAGIISELLNQIENKQALNTTSTESEILGALTAISGKIKNPGSIELSSEKKFNHFVKSSLPITKTNAWQIGNLAKSEKAKSKVEISVIAQNAIKMNASGLNKSTGQKKQRSILKVAPQDLISKKNFKKELTQRNKTSVITKPNLSKLNLLNKGTATPEGLKNFNTQLKTEKNSSSRIANIQNESFPKSTIDKFTETKTGSVMNQETLKKIISASAEIPVSKNLGGTGKRIEHEFDEIINNNTKPQNVRSSQVTTRKLNGNLKNGISSENQIKGNSEPEIKKLDQSVEHTKKKILDHSKNILERIGKVNNLNTLAKTTDSKGSIEPLALTKPPNEKEIGIKDNLTQRNVESTSTKRIQFSKAVVNDDSFLITGKKLSNSQNISVVMPIIKNVKAFNSAGKRVNTVVAKASLV